MTDHSSFLEAMRTARIDVAVAAIAKALREEAMSARISECYRTARKRLRSQERLYEQLEAVGREIRDGAGR
jgi:hypothetical protein